jgi:hypothetical protein
MPSGRKRGSSSPAALTATERKRFDYGYYRQYHIPLPQSARRGAC